MFLTTQETRRITVTILIAVIIILAVAAYFYFEPMKIFSANTDNTQESEEKTETPQTGIKTYTQYDGSQRTCAYHYENKQCYVPLSFCVTDPSVKTTQEIDAKKYCSETPQISAQALVSPAGSTCPFTATEGDLIDLFSIVRDPDEGDPSHPYGPLGRLEVSFSEPFKGNKGLWKTEPGDAGVYYFEISVTDGEFTDTNHYCIEVKMGNRPPVISNIHDAQVFVGEMITLEPTCVDPDGDAVTISYIGDLSDREWYTGTPKRAEEKDLGLHIVTVRCTDNRGLPAYKSIKARVLATTAAPPPTIQFIEELANITIMEGETVTLSPQVESDVGRPVTITYGGWMESSSKTASFTDSGVHEVTVTATDGISTISTTITITVINVNRPPEIVGTQASE